MSATDLLQLERTWLTDRRLVTCWRQQSRPILQQTRRRLHSELRRSLYRSSVHLKGHGGVKGALRRITRQQGSHRYVARYYESIQHDLLLLILRDRGASAKSLAVVKDYLRLPDRHRSGRGMTAGGCLSPLLAAVMLIPLGEAINRLWRRLGRGWRGWCRVAALTEPCSIQRYLAGVGLSSRAPPRVASGSRGRRIAASRWCRAV